MGKKHTYEFVKQSFENDGYELLSKEYINANTKLNYKCPKSHEHSIRWHDWNNGHKCPSCYGNTKLTIELAKQLFEKENYILLSKEYNNASTKLYYQCFKGHNHFTTLRSWRIGQRCPTCAGKTKPTIDQIGNYFNQEGYILLSKKYKNAHIKLEYKCPEGHRHSIKWNSWQQGHRCPTCYYLSKYGPGNPNWKGGISCNPYCSIWNDKEYKQDIRNRDGNKCLNPACTKKYSGLTIHHIDYNKKNCSPSNLITVCNSCNGIANFDREWHTAWYKALLYRRYKLC